MSPIRVALIAALLSSPCRPGVAAGDAGHEWVVATVTRGGAWGVGTGERHAVALTAALRDCRTKAGGPSECGAQTAAAQKGWILAFRCGQRLILVAGQDLPEAQAAAGRRMTELREAYDADLPPCRQMLTVGPDGIATAVAPDMAAN